MMMFRSQAQLLAALYRAPISALRRYDREHTHLLRSPAESWTPYHELVDLISLVPPHGTLLDLGAGTGRALCTATLLRPDIRCVGFEVVAERVALAERALQRLRATARARVLRRELGGSRLPLPSFDQMVVYLFNPFSPATLSAVLHALVVLASTCAYVLVLKGMEESLLEADSAWLPLR